MTNAFRPLQQGLQYLSDLKRMQRDLMTNSPDLEAAPGMGRAIVDSADCNDPVALHILAALNAMRRHLKRRHPNR